MECFLCFSAKHLEAYVDLNKQGFTCYLNTGSNINTRITGCWPHDFETLEKERPEQDRLISMVQGNVYCVNRHNAHALLLALDNMSLYRYAPDGPRGYDVVYPPTFSPTARPTKV